MSNCNRLKEAVERKFDLNLWPQQFFYGFALVAACNRLNIDAVIMALIAGTAIFVGKSEIVLEGSDKTESGSLWIVNVQVRIYIFRSDINT